MILVNENSVEKSKKGIWKLRDLSEAVEAKRQREIINFFRNIVIEEEYVSHQELD